MKPFTSLLQDCTMVQPRTLWKSSLSGVFTVVMVDSIDGSMVTFRLSSYNPEHNNIIITMERHMLSVHDFRKRYSFFRRI